MSLVRLASEGNLPDAQFMDDETCDWIRNNRPNFFVKLDETLKLLDLVKDYEFLKKMEPNIEWFRHEKNYYSIHGARHLIRCQIYAYIIGKYYRLSKDDAYALIIAAGVHDVARENDKDDMGHSARSAKWFMNNVELFKGLNEDLMNRVYVSVLYHNSNSTPDNLLEKEILMVKFLKLVDSLDRYRLPKLKWWPDRGVTEIDCPEALYKFAFDLVLSSEQESLSNNNNGLGVFKALERLINEYAR